MTDGAGLTIAGPSRLESRDPGTRIRESLSDRGRFGGLERNFIRFGWRSDPRNLGLQSRPWVPAQVGRLVTPGPFRMTRNTLCQRLLEKNLEFALAKGGNNHYDPRL